MIDDLVGNAQFRPSSQWFAAAGIADKAWVSAARDLDANALSLSEVVGGWPDLDGDMQAAIGFRGNAPRGQTQNAITQVACVFSYHKELNWRLVQPLPLPFDMRIQPGQCFADDHATVAETGMGPMADEQVGLFPHPAR